jgi:MFS family permease
MPRIRVLTFGLMTAVLASGYGVMFTVLDDFRDDYGIRAEWLGVIVGVGFLSSFVAQIFLAPIADRGYARALVIGGIVLNLIGLLGMAIGETVTVLLIARFIMGIGVGGATPAVRRIVINGDPERLGNNLGLLLAADVAGFAAGPVVSALLVPSFGIPAPFLVIAGVSVLTLPVIVRADVNEAAADAAPQSHFAFDLLRLRPMMAALLMGAALFLMIGTFDALWAIVLDDLDASEFVSNLGIAIFALPLIFLGSYGGRLAQRLGPFRFGPFGLLLGATYMFLYGFMPTGFLMLAVGIVHGICDGLTVSSNAIAVGMVAPPERQASAQGMLGAAQTLTGGITAVLAGVLYGWGGRVLAYTACSIVMVGLAAAAWVLAGPEFRARRGDIALTPVEPAPAIG